MKIFIAALAVAFAFTPFVSQEVPLGWCSEQLIAAGPGPCT
jgi:hypothetical protein